MHGTCRPGTWNSKTGRVAAALRAARARARRAGALTPRSLKWLLSWQGSRGSLLLSLGLHVLVVCRAVHEGREVARELDLDEPAVGLRAAVDRGGLVGELAVDLDNLAIRGRVDLAHGLDALQGADRLLATESRALVRQIAVDDLAQLALGEVRDAEDADVALHAHPLVRLRELHVREGAREDWPRQQGRGQRPAGGRGGEAGGAAEEQGSGHSSGGRENAARSGRALAERLAGRLGTGGRL